MNARVPVASQAAAGGEKLFKIYRWNPDNEGEKPYMATYPVNTKE